MSLASAAIDYASMLGLSVFPVAADCRVPIKAEGWFERGVHDATKDPAEVRRRWEAYPAANIAVACGPASGVFALDVDTKGADGFESLRALEARFGQLPLTWRAATPSGGAHLFFRQPERGLRNRVNSLCLNRPDGSVEAWFRGLDVRTTGGSVAVAPSAKPHGSYSWILDPVDLELADAPGWLLEIIDPPPPPLKPLQRITVDRQDRRAADRLARYVEKAVDGECRELATMKPSTGRNLRLFQAAANLGEFVGAGLLTDQMVYAALEQAAHACGLLHDDGPHAVRASIRSGLQRGVQSPREVQA